MSSQESERKTIKKYEPTPNFSRVFSQNVGKKTRPSVNVKLKENPRLINLSDKRTQQSKENETEHTTQMNAQESDPKPLKKLEPAANFDKVFSEIIGRKPNNVDWYLH